MVVSCSEAEARTMGLPLAILPASDDPQDVLEWYQQQQIAALMDNLTVNTSDGRSYRMWRRIVRDGKVSWEPNPNMPDNVRRLASKALSAGEGEQVTDARSLGVAVALA